jgi:F-type H+-transporting ATPase subunit epsilon
MRLKIYTPLEVFFDSHVIKINAEAENGFFTVLEHHADFSVSLAPSILTLEMKHDGNVIKKYFAVDQGAIVKQNENVTISALKVIEGDDLSLLQDRVQAEFKEITEEEKNARTALARLEGNVAKLILEATKR